MLYKDIWISIIQFIDDEETLYNLRKISEHIRTYVDNYSTPTIEIENMNQYHKIPFRKCKFIINNAKKFSDKNLNVIGNKLIELDLWKNNTITDNGLKTLINLTELYLYDNNTITDEYIYFLKSNNVKIINIYS